MTGIERGPVCPPDHKHELTCYTHHGCRCGRCVTYRREQQYWRRNMIAAGRTHLVTIYVDGRGVRRRLQALMTLGWSNTRLAEQLDRSPDQVNLWLYSDRVSAATHDLIATLYDRLFNTPAPTRTRGERQGASRTRNAAAARGYARPIDWDDIDLDDAPPSPERTDLPDEIAIELALAGHQVNLTPAERRIAVRRAHRDGGSDREIAARSSCDVRTVERIRKELHLPANVDAGGWRVAA